MKYESTLRKFTVIFLTLFFLPLLNLFFLIHNVKIDSTAFYNEYGLFIDKPLIDRLFILFVVASLVFFFWGRKIFISLIKITQKAEEISKGNLGLRIDAGEDKEIMTLAHSFNEITRKLEENIERLQMSKRTLQEVLYRISTGITDTAKNIDTFLKLILDTTMSAIDSRRGALILLNTDNPTLYVQCSQGYSDEVLQRKIQPDSEEAWVINNAKPLIVPKVDKGSESFICVSLKYREKIIGALSFSGRIVEADFSPDDAILLSHIASQTAGAIVNERLNTDAEQTYKQTISALASAVEARDSYSRGHSDRVAKYAVMVARKIGLDEKTILTIQDAAELHDVGKIGIEDEILRKAGPLTPEEMTIMRKHPAIGESIVKPIHSLSNLCDLIRHHHEFLDGSGYPDALKADDISVGPRILAICDAFDAMTSDRPYRKAKSLDEAIAELRKFSHSHYDEKIVEAFIEAFLEDKKKDPL